MRKMIPALAVLLAMTAPVAAGEDLTFKLTNMSSDDVVAFHVSHSGTAQWEENLIEGGYLPSGNEIDVLIADGLTTCTYDIKTVFSNGFELEEYGMDLCELGSYTLQDR